MIHPGENIVIQMPVQSAECMERIEARAELYAGLEVSWESDGSALRLSYDERALTKDEALKLLREILQVEGIEMSVDEE